MTAANISEFENKSLEELVSFSADLDILIRKKRKQEAKQVRAKMDELAKAAGFESVDDFMANQGGRQPRSDKGVKLPPKYRNPQNHDETWSGKGPTPKWLKEYMNGGGDKESCRIHS
ncbi:MAG: H-NS histone family protein [Magnetococcales bacterium]|nr:H-NS histone family protein [Magnetococcales bacterium]